MPVRERVLVLSRVVSIRNGNGLYSVADLRHMFDVLRLPPPGNPSATLGQLRDAKPNLAIYRTSDRLWGLTPIGQREADQLIGNFDYKQIEAELAGTPGAEYAQEKHAVIPPSFAPPKWQQGITRLLERFPFETNVFLMTRFPKLRETEMPDPVAGAIDALRNVVAQHGLHLHLASDRQAEDEIFGNVVAHIWACQFGIGLLEDRGESQAGLNDNVLIELGSMLVTGRRCAILKDRAAPHPPSDLSSHIYKTVDFDYLGTIADAAHRWLADDLMLGNCASCPSPLTIPPVLTVLTDNPE